MSTGTTTYESRTLLRDVTWQQYVSLRDGDEYRNTRMTFDRGSLELMSPSRLHERLRIVIGKCVDAWFEELDIPYQSCGSTTFRREDLERGLEPDNCYYIRNVSVVQDRAEELDLTIDPPPDLVLEVDVTSSSLNRMSIYAALGVPEIWRWQHDKLQVYSLGADGRYVTASDSLAVPGFSIERVAQFAKLHSFAVETSLAREIRTFVRDMRNSGGESP